MNITQFNEYIWEDILLYVDYRSIKAILCTHIDICKTLNKIVITSNTFWHKRLSIIYDLSEISTAEYPWKLLTAQLYYLGADVWSKRKSSVCIIYDAIYCKCCDVLRLFLPKIYDIANPEVLMRNILDVMIKELAYCCIKIFVEVTDYDVTQTIITLLSDFNVGKTEITLERLNELIRILTSTGNYNPNSRLPDKYMLEYISNDILMSFTEHSKFDPTNMADIICEIIDYNDRAIVDRFIVINGYLGVFAEHIAGEDGSRNVLWYLLSHSLCNKRDVGRALHGAASAYDPGLVLQLLDREFEIDPTYQPLVAAVLANDVKIINILLNDPRTSTPNAIYTSLIYANDSIKSFLQRN